MPDPTTSDSSCAPDLRGARPEERARLRAMIQAQTAPLRPALTPEFQIWGASEYAAIWTATEETLDAMGLPPPFWAFAWPGGQTLARLLLDRPELAHGKRALAVGAGAGLEALAAARAGAARAIANDIDPAAQEAARLNAELNGLPLEICGADLTAKAADAAAPPAPEADLLMLGDALYEHGPAAALTRLARTAAAAGATVLIADAGRGFLDPSGMRRIAEIRAPTMRALEDRPFRDVAVWRLGPEP